MAKKKFLPQETTKLTNEIITNKIAFRRSKVQQLAMRGFSTMDMQIILSKGVKDVNGKTIPLTTTIATIEKDLDYLSQERIANEKDYFQKRAEILDKLNFLYHRAIEDYLSCNLNSKEGSNRSKFLNTSLSIMKEISDIEGIVRQEDATKMQFTQNNLILNTASEAEKLTDQEKNDLIAAIDQAIGK